MSAFVVDTNVPIVANGVSEQAGPECVLACVKALDEVMRGLTCLDDGGRILREYMDNLNMSGQPGAGDLFMKWIFQNQADVTNCETVSITRTDDDFENYAEFPDDPELQNFDVSDRKFVAVALQSEHSPSVLNAVDSDWWDALEALSRNGLTVQFLCAGQFE